MCRTKTIITTNTTTPEEKTINLEGMDVKDGQEGKA
jgi:hypothetical protein